MRNEPAFEEFTYSASDPMALYHADVAAWVEESLQSVGRQRWYCDLDLEALPIGKKLLDADANNARLYVMAALTQVRYWGKQAHLYRMSVPPAEENSVTSTPLWAILWGRRRKAESVIRALLRRNLPFQDAELIELLDWPAGEGSISHYTTPVSHIAGASERFVGNRSISPDLDAAMKRFADTMRNSNDKEVQRAGHRVERLLKDENPRMPIVPGEAWSDCAIADIKALGNQAAERWSLLLAHCERATSATPSKRWMENAKKALDGVGASLLREHVVRWFPLVDLPRTQELTYETPWQADRNHLIIDPHMNVLRGLCWLSTFIADDEVVRSLSKLARSAYRKVPQIGPRAVRVGNACLYALSVIGNEAAVAQLAVLKVRVRFGSAQKEIEKAFDSAAAKLSIPRDQIEEMGVPTYGLEEVGRSREEIEGYIAELLVTGSNAELKWNDANGKQLKSAPARVKVAHKDEFKELQQTLKDIQAMLPAQRDRIDSMFLLQKCWPLNDWRERYIDHALVGTIARRLIWNLDGIGVVFQEGMPTDVSGGPVQCSASSKVTLWHPIGRTFEEIAGWRQRLEMLGISQPFKQAHREVYLLTDAERNTQTYSNRFAAHVIRQHQFNALCAARGWKNKLRLMVDDEYPPPAKSLPSWGLRAEFWVEGAGSEYGTDTNDSGVFLRLTTDQLRFYRLDASQNRVHAYGGRYETLAVGPGENNINEPLSLDQVPPLVFSEIMRDVDLFVGVASVGNDPNWSDGGPDGHYRDYWHTYSFGDLSATASTRRDVLLRLIPRLKIASQCSFSDKFLIVKGAKRTYKIHLGSGNILMEPNDQYLCIVPDARARAGQEKLFLPFEGDNTLSIIISKAFLLADDATITDRTIVRQIRG